MIFFNKTDLRNCQILVPRFIDQFNSPFWTAVWSRPFKKSEIVEKLKNIYIFYFCVENLICEIVGNKFDFWNCKLLYGKFMKNNYLC